MAVVRGSLQVLLRSDQSFTPVSSLPDYLKLHLVAVGRGSLQVLLRSDQFFTPVSSLPDYLKLHLVAVGRGSLQDILIRHGFTCQHPASLSLGST